MRRSVWINRGAAALLAVMAVGVAPLMAEEPGSGMAEGEIPAITVRATPFQPPDIADSALSAVQVLDYLQQATLNSQGGSGRQDDLVIRGSSFSGAGFAIGGLALRNPQTEHFHTELPLHPALFAAPGVLTGMRQVLGADGFLVGTVDFRFAEAGQVRRLELGVGERSRHWQQALIGTGPAHGPTGPVPVVEGFAWHETAGGIDLPDNTLDRAGGGARLQWRGDEGQQHDVAVGYQRKEIGARGYYGVNPAFPATEEIEDLLVVGAGRFSGALGWSAYARELKDDYQLQLPGGLFRNEHRSRVGAGSLDGRWTATGTLGLSWRLSGREEQIRSTALSDDSRSQGAFTLVPESDLGRVRLAAGGRLEVFSGDRPAWLAQGGVEVDLSEAVTWHASYNETVRQPSYTELNYESPGSLGQAGLKRQEAASMETGLRLDPMPGLRVQVAGFVRQGRRTVDWVKATPEDRWTAVNLGTVTTRGVEAGGNYSPSADIPLWLELQYTWLDKDHDAGVHAGRYELDYARHTLKASVNWMVTPEWVLSMRQTLRQQQENPVRESSDFGAVGAVALSWLPARWQGVTLTGRVENVWDDDFQALPDQPVASRRMSLALVKDW